MSNWKSYRPADTAHPFSKTLTDGNTIYVSGVGGWRQDRTISDDAGEQAREALNSMKGLLEQAGSSMDEIVVFRPILTDRADLEAVNDVFLEFFTAPLPAAQALLVTPLVLPQMKVEFEATAVKGARRVS